MKKNIEFVQTGPTALIVILNITLPNQANFKKSLHIYFYIPSEESGKEEASIISKYPTKFHGPVKIFDE